MYGHKSISQGYTHYHQPLAHPLGANFKEAVATASYHYKDFYVDVKVSYAFYGDDSTGTHYGNNVFLSDFDATRGITSYGNYIGQGVATHLMYEDFRFSYLINPVINWKVFGGVTLRNQSTDDETLKNSYVYFGMATSLRNLYYDF
jgi:hypothetical protein